jgi:hypothetical protein
MRVPAPYILFAIALLFALGLRTARAGDYHRGADLVCSDCHVIHYDIQHGYTGGPPAAPVPGGPYPKLLKNTAAELCLSCHDGQVGSGDIAPDVMQEAGLGQPAARAAGAFQELVGTETPNGHSLLVSATPPGGTAAMTLDCLSCHDAHGNGYYRNLVPNPGGASGLGVTAVAQTQTTPTADHYSVANMRYTASDGGLSAWCGGCHGDFHGGAGSPDMGGSPVGDTNLSSVSPWLRHPTRDVTMGQAVTNQHVDSSYWFSALESRLPVVSASGAVPGFGSGSDNQVFCGTCHKAHGSPHRYGLIWDNPTTALPEDGSSVMDSCQQCHHK